MRRVTLLCVGRLKEKFYTEAAAEYAKRLSHFCRLEIIELPEERLSERPSPAQVEAALGREAEALRRRIPSGASVTDLCVEGDLISSEALSAWLAARTDALAFIIGGSYGLHSSLKQEAAWKLSLSPMTFPHHLARVMLLEQLYRAFQMDAGGRYHK